MKKQGIQVKARDGLTILHPKGRSFLIGDLDGRGVHLTVFAKDDSQLALYAPNEWISASVVQS